MVSRDEMRALELSHIGIVFAAFLGGAIYLGLEADKRFGTTPFGVLAGMLLGFFGGFYHLYISVFTDRTNGGPDGPQGDEPE